MPPVIYFYRQRNRGWMIADQSDRALPKLEQVQGFEPGDWELVQGVPNSELPNMLSNLDTIEKALAAYGYYAISPSDFIEDHPFWQRRKG